jgi:hypothetical protein
MAIRSAGVFSRKIFAIASSITSIRRQSTVNLNARSLPVFVQLLPASPADHGMSFALPNLHGLAPPGAAGT